MGNRFVEPTSESITELLEIIFGEGVEPNPVGDAGDADGALARFIDDEDKLVAICVCDMPFVCYTGAALSMIPADAANEIVASGEVSDTIKDNFYEVMNICSKLFMSDHSDHLRLDNVIPVSDGASDREALSASAERRNFEIGVPGYGVGKMEFIYV